MTEQKDRGRSPEDKATETTMARVNRENREAAAKREGKEGDEEEVEYGPDGVYHTMEAEMLANAKTKDAPENQAPILPSVIHAEELRMKGDGVAPIDPTPPDPEAPIDARALADADRNPKPTQMPADRSGKRR